jgi:hypothetical protein
MEQTRARNAASATSSSSSSAFSTTPTLPSAARMQERSALLAQGEAALARSNTDAAQAAFEAAATILHAADTEMGIVRTHMQTGQYRRALAFGAHTAGAHLDVVGGSALYAWLLHMGGQSSVAQRLLNEAHNRAPNQTLLTLVQVQLQSAAPLAAGPMLQTPVRMAPYGPQSGLPTAAQVVGSGLLIDQGSRVLVPTATLAKASRLWVRNGLGQLSPAKVERSFGDLQVVVLKLTRTLPMDEPLALSPKDAFPGSVAFAIEYVPSSDATPRWPLLHTGFMGGFGANGQARLLSIAMPQGPRGGPVFDDAGRLTGMAVRRSGSPDQLVMASQLHQRLGSQLGRMAEASSPRPRMAADQIYESTLRSAVQVIAAR